MKRQYWSHRTYLLIFVSSLDMLGIALSALGLAAYVQYESNQSAKYLLDLLYAQAQIFGKAQQEARSAIHSRDRLIRSMLDEMPPEKRAQWDSQIEQFPEMTASANLPPNLEVPPPVGWAIYPIGAVVCCALGILALVVLTRSRLRSRHKSKRDDQPVYESDEPSILRGYREIFSKELDPIGGLHRWRIEAEEQLSERQLTIRKLKDMQSRGESPRLVSGILHVRSLEGFLDRHCGIRRIEEYGKRVRFDPSIHDAGGANISEGALVQVYSPGWKWKDRFLRYPKVKYHG